MSCQLIFHDRRTKPSPDCNNRLDGRHLCSSEALKLLPYLLHVNHKFSLNSPFIAIKFNCRYLFLTHTHYRTIEDCVWLLYSDLTMTPALPGQPWPCSIVIFLPIFKVLSWVTIWTNGNADGFDAWPMRMKKFNIPVVQCALVLANSSLWAKHLISRVIKMFLKYKEEGLGTELSSELNLKF